MYVACSGAQLVRWQIKAEPSQTMMTSSNGTIFRVTGPLCGEFIGPGEFPTQRPVTRSFDVYFVLRPNKRLSKQWWGWWFETLSWSLWRHRNDLREVQWNLDWYGRSRYLNQCYAMLIGPLWTRSNSFYTEIGHLSYGKLILQMSSAK